MSQETDYNFHIQNFSDLASKFKGHVKRCYFSFPIFYNKVKKQFSSFEEKHRITILDPDEEKKIKLANDLSDIALSNGIRMYTCCGNYLINENIYKASCIDGDVIAELFFKDSPGFKKRATRKNCGCAESTDIGKYDTCPHGCIYCYANLNKEKATQAFKNHKPECCFLGYPKEQCDDWLKEIKDTLPSDNGQMSFWE